jgi:hypothetical protein
MDQIRNTEVGVLRALAQSLGSAKLPALPTFEEAVRQTRPLEFQLPPWQVQFEAVNKDRRIH